MHISDLFQTTPIRNKTSFLFEKLISNCYVTIQTKYMNTNKTHNDAQQRYNDNNNNLNKPRPFHEF